MEIAEFHNAVKSRARMSFRNYRNFVSIARIFAIASLDVLRKETSIRDRYRRGGASKSFLLEVISRYRSHTRLDHSTRWSELIAVRLATTLRGKLSERSERADEG